MYLDCSLHTARILALTVSEDPTVCGARGALFRLAGIASGRLLLLLLMNGNSAFCLSKSDSLSQMSRFPAFRSASSLSGIRGKDCRLAVTTAAGPQQSNKHNMIRNDKSVEVKLSPRQNWELGSIWRLLSQEGCGNASLHRETSMGLRYGRWDTHRCCDQGSYRGDVPISAS